MTILKQRFSSVEEDLHSFEKSILLLGAGLSIKYDYYSSQERNLEVM